MTWLIVNVDFARFLPTIQPILAYHGCFTAATVSTGEIQVDNADR